MPNGTAELWESYIDRRLTYDEEEKLIKQSINPPLIKTYSKKISLINELMKTNVFKEDDLYKLVENSSSDFAEFKKNPLIDKQKGKPIWFFEHRNIQEYFAALTISSKELKSILEFIQIRDTTRTHPSLFNTITFLINLLNKGSNKYDELVDWFVNNEPELLFRADFDRISNDVKVKVFQLYFKKECIEKTLWINTNRTYEIDKIAKFSNCKGNYEYLIDIYKNNSFHIRTRYSALEILAFFSIPDGEVLNLKKALLSQLKDITIEAPIKAQIVRLIHFKKELKNDDELIEELFSIFKAETNKEINTTLLSLINDFDNIEKYSDYVQEEFLRAHGLKKRDEEDEVGRGNEYKSQELILRLEAPEAFLEIIKYYFNDDINLNYNEDFAKKLLERCVYFSKQKKDFVVKLLSELKEEHRFHSHERLLKQIIIDCDSNTESLLFLLQNEKFTKINYFVSGLVDDSNVEEVVRIILEKEIEHNEIERFRNFIGNFNHNSRNIAVKFDLLMREKGIKFVKEVYTDEKREIDKVASQKNIQNQLNILFDKESLLKEIVLLFNNTNGVLTWEDTSKIRNKWYEDNGSANVLINSSLDIIDSIMQRRSFSLKFEEVKKVINNETVLFFELKKLTERYKSSQWKFTLLEEHKIVIKNWCVNSALQIDFSNIIKLNNRGSFTFLNNDYKKIELIFYFQDLVKFDLPKTFLLNCIEFFEFDRTSEVDENFEKLKEQINDISSFNNKIVDNIINKELFAFSLSKHIEYALANNLKKSFTKIREYLKENDSSYNNSKKLKKYIELTGDHNILLECCTNSNSYLYWYAIEIMIELNINKDFCLNKSLDYIKVEDDKFNSYALQNLFKLNNIKAIEFLVESAEKNNINSIRTIQYSDYNAFNGYEIIEKLFNLIYNKEFDRFEYNNYSSFLKTYISNLSIEKEKYEEIIKILDKIKSKLKEYGADLFHINLLIDDVKDSYFNSQSNAFDFQEAFKRVNEIIN